MNNKYKREKNKLSYTSIFFGIGMLLIGFFIGSSFLPSLTENSINNKPVLKTQPYELEIVSPPSETPLQQQKTFNFLTTGKTGSDGGLDFTLESWGESPSIPIRRNNKLHAKENAKFVWVKIKFQNNSKDSADIHCSYDLGSTLFDKEGRKFDHIRSLYKIEGNTGCNDNIQPGFSSHEIIAFEMPIQFKPDYVMFWNPQEYIGDNNDSFGKSSATRFLLN